MDTVTSAIGGALVTKAFFTDAAAPAPPAAPQLAERARRQARRVALGAGILAAIFPDFDSFFDLFASSPVARIEMHRGITHSFVMLPLWALGLAAATRWLVRRLGWAAPSFRFLYGLYAALLTFHIWTDLITSYGTQIWRPLARTRVSWDLVFIIDFSFTAILLLPQVAAWVHRRAEGAVRRAAAMWAVFTLAAVGVERLALSVGAAISPAAVAVASVVFAAVFFLPLVRRWGAGISRAAWCRAGVAALAVYAGLCWVAHREALERVERFIAERQLTVENHAALPFPPALTRWKGMVRTPDGVYMGRFSVLDTAAPEFRFFPDDAPNGVTAAVRRLPELETYLWFARFPVMHYSREGDRHVVEFADLQFSRGDDSRAGPFTYRVVLDAEGNVVAQGWVED